MEEEKFFDLGFSADDTDDTTVIDNIKVVSDDSDSTNYSSVANTGFSYIPSWNNIDTATLLASLFTPSSDGSYHFSTSNAQGYEFSFSFQDILSGYTYYANNSVDSFYKYDISGYQNGDTSAQTKSFTNGIVTNDYTARTLYNVGDRNGYLSNYKNNTGAMFFVDSNISSYKRQNDYVSFDMGNGTSFQAQTSGSENDIFQYTTDGKNISYAKLGYTGKDNSFIYEDGVNLYSGSDHEDTLKLTTYDAKNIWLDGSQGVTYANINNIDAREASGDNQLAGNAEDNKIRAGSGNDLLWGAGGNDELYGGSGDNTYYYGVNEGSDVIYNSVATDKVDLYNVSLTDIVSANEVGQNFVLNMAGGESLTIVGQNGASNFRLSDNSEYHYSREDHSWTKTK